MVVGELVASAMEMERRWRLGFGREAQRERRGISQKAIFFLISNGYNSPIFIVPSGLASQVTMGNILINRISLS
jgi:hypothetical protein